MWINLFLLVASYIISAAMRPKPIVQKPPAFEEIEFPQFEVGTPQEVIFGDCWTESWMVLGLGNYRVKQVKVSVGKKGGGGGTVGNSFTTSE